MFRPFSWLWPTFETNDMASSLNQESARLAQRKALPLMLMVAGALLAYGAVKLWQAPAEAVGHAAMEALTWFAHALVSLELFLTKHHVLHALIFTMGVLWMCTEVRCANTLFALLRKPEITLEDEALAQRVYKLSRWWPTVTLTFIAVLTVSAFAVLFIKFKMGITPGHDEAMQVIGSVAATIFMQLIVTPFALSAEVREVTGDHTATAWLHQRIMRRGPTALRIAASTPAVDSSSTTTAVA